MKTKYLLLNQEVSISGCLVTVARIETFPSGDREYLLREDSGDAYELYQKADGTIDSIKKI